MQKKEEGEEGQNEENKNKKKPVSHFLISRQNQTKNKCKRKLFMRNESNKKKSGKNKMTQ